MPPMPRYSACSSAAVKRWIGLRMRTAVRHWMLARYMHRPGRRETSTSAGRCRTSFAPGGSQLLGQHVLQAEERLGDHVEWFSSSAFPFSGRQQAHELRQNREHGPCPMAEHGLDLGRQLAERAMVFDDLEQRIVAESAAAGLPSRESGPGNGRWLSARIVPRGSASARWHTKWAVRRAVGTPASAASSLWRLSASVAAGRHSGPNRIPGAPCERVDHQPAVVAQHPAAQVRRLLRGFERRVLGERCAGFVDGQRRREIGQRLQRQPQRREQARPVRRPSCDCRCRTPSVRDGGSCFDGSRLITGSPADCGVLPACRASRRRGWPPAARRPDFLAASRRRPAVADRGRSVARDLAAGASSSSSTRKSRTPRLSSCGTASAALCGTALNSVLRQPTSAVSGCSMPMRSRSSHLVHVAGPAAVVLVRARREHRAEHAVLHVKHRHVLMNDDFQPLGRHRGDQVQQLLAVQVVRRRHALRARASADSRPSTRWWR